MNTRLKMIGLALPLAGLLAMGGTALAQMAGASAGTPASTRVVQQAAIHRAGEISPAHAVKTEDKPAQQRLQERERDHETRGDHHEARTADHMTDRNHDSHAERADR
jgi:hypothetical protein